MKRKISAMTILQKPSSFVQAHRITGCRRNVNPTTKYPIIYIQIDKNNLKHSNFYSKLKLKLTKDAHAEAFGSSGNNFRSKNTQRPEEVKGFSEKCKIEN